MVNSVFFLAAFALLLGGLVFCPKTEKKLGFIQETVMNVLFLLCYGTLGSMGFTILKVSVNLRSMGILYLVPAVLLWLYIFRKKKVQKLTISRIEAVSVLLLTVLFMAVELKVFSFEMRAAYDYNTDAGNHLGMALSIVRTGKVSGMHFASLFNALCIEIFQPVLEEIKYYKGFVFADSLHYYVEMLFAYAVIYGLAKKRHTKYLAVLVTALLWMGYPLYSYIEGHYVYWGWGAALLCFMLYELEQAAEENGHYVWNIIRASAAFTGVVFCYALFAPLALIMIAVWGVMEIKKRNIHFGGKVLGGIGIAGGLCAVAGGYVYYTYFYLTGQNPFEGLKVHGGSFGPHLFNDFVWTLPVILLFFGACFKKEIKFHVYGSAYLAAWIFQAFLLAAFFAGQISDYYYFKFYYPLWFLNWIVVALAIDTVPMEKKERKYFYAYGATVLLIYISCFGQISVRVNSTPAGWLTNQGDMGTYLYSRNMRTLEKDFEQSKYSTAQLEICEYVMENLRPQGENVPFAYWWDCGGPNNWYRSITGMSGSIEARIRNGRENEWKKILEIKRFNYYVVLKGSELYKDNQDYFDSQTWIFENEEGFIVQKNQTPEEE